MQFKEKLQRHSKRKAEQVFEREEERNRIMPVWDDHCQNAEGQRGQSGCGTDVDIVGKEATIKRTQSVEWLRFELWTAGDSRLTRVTSLVVACARLFVRL